jgi:hypothetical protein
LLQIKAAKGETVHDGSLLPKAGWFAMTDRDGISRRKVLTVAAGTAGAAIGVVAIVGASTPAKAAKASQKSVKYQDTPKGDARCDNCTLFEAPNACKTVEGPIAPEGWCMIYAKKQE